MLPIDSESRLRISRLKRGRRTWTTSQDVSGKIIPDTPQIRFDFLPDPQETTTIAETRERWPPTLRQGIQLKESTTQNEEPPDEEKVIFVA